MVDYSKPITDGDIKKAKTWYDIVCWGGLLIVLLPVGIANLILGYLMGDSPCTLCWGQREQMAFIGVVALFMVRYGFKPKYLATMLVMAAVGLWSSFRHLGVHAARDVGQGFGLEIMGLHTQMWAEIVFWCVVMLFGLALFAYAPNAERLGIKFEHNAANAPVVLNGSLKIEETRAVQGISAKLNTIAKIRGEYVVASKYDFWFLNADLSPKFHAAMDPWFSANVLDLVGITALDKDAYVLMGSNKSLLRVRQNPEADDVQGWPNFTAGRSHIEAVGGLGRARIDTERAKFSYIHSSATDGRYVFMATVPDNKNKKQFVISKALMKDWMLSGEFVPTAEMLKKDRSLGELYVTGMVYEDGKLYAVSKNWNVLVVIDVAQEAVVEAWGLPEELTDIRGLVKDGSTFEVIDANRVVKLTM